MISFFNDDVKNKLNKWMHEFSGRMNCEEDGNLFDALYACICWRVDDKELSAYLQDNKDKFMVETNTDLLICHAIDCYHAMKYLIWAQNGKLCKDNPMFY